MKERRREAFSRWGREASLKIARHGIGFSGVRPPLVVTSFLPIGEEIDPEPLMTRLISEGYSVALPVMVGKGLPLEFRRWAPGEPLAETTWGIRNHCPKPVSSIPMWCWGRCSPSMRRAIALVTAADFTTGRSRISAPLACRLDRARLRRAEGRRRASSRL